MNMSIKKELGNECNTKGNQQCHYNDGLQQVKKASCRMICISVEVLEKNPLWRL